MDFKIVVVIVAVAFSGYLFWQNQKRDQLIVDLTRRVQASTQVAVNSAAHTMINDAALLQVIKDSVRAEAEANPRECGKAKLAGSDAAKLQELILRLNAFEKVFNKAVADVDAHSELNEKIASRANKIKDKVVELCRRK